MERMSQNLVKDKKYKTRNPDKIALLQCMGAKIVKRDVSDPDRIIFVLQHEKIADFVEAIHNGNPELYLKESAASFAEYRKALMKFIKEAQLNTRG